MLKFRIGDREVAVGQRVTGDVTWKDGRVSNVEGTLITVAEGFAYIESRFGAVESPIDSVEVIDG